MLPVCQQQLAITLNGFVNRTCVNKSGCFHRDSATNVWLSVPNSGKPGALISIRSPTLANGLPSPGKQSQPSISTSPGCSVMNSLTSRSRVSASRCRFAKSIVCTTAPFTRMSRSLGGRRNVGCKSTAAVYFSPISCQISRYSAAKSSKTIPSLGPIFAQTPSAAQAPSLNCAGSPAALGLTSCELTPKNPSRHLNSTGGLKKLACSIDKSFIKTKPAN